MKSAIVIILLLGISAIIFPDVFAHNTDLLVSAENSQFKNHFAGPMIIEVMVNGSNIDEKIEELDVSVNGKTLQMEKAEDANWYGYFASKLDSLTVDGLQGSQIGKGLDFGMGLTTSCSFHLGINKTEASGVFVPNVMANLDSVAPGFLTNCDSKEDYKPGKQSMNVLKNVEKISSDNLEGKWPFIQLFDFNRGENVIVQYNKDGTTLGVNLTFEALPHLNFTKLELDGNGNYPESHVYLNVTDFQLNIDPTSKDSWTWAMAEPGGLFYQVFDEEGNPDEDGISGAVDISSGLTDVMFGDHGNLVLDKNRINFQSTVNFTDNGLQKITPVDAGFQPITFIESEENSGIFRNFDGKNNSNLVILPDAIPTGKDGFADTLVYNGELHLILILHSNVTMSWDKPEYSMNESAILSMKGIGLNKNSTEIDSFYVNVTSGANKEGIALWLKETNENSGDFKGNIKFVNSTSKNELFVFDGDTVLASFFDMGLDGSSIEKTTSITKWDLKGPKEKLESCGITIDFPENIDDDFSVIGKIEDQLERMGFDSDRVETEYDPIVSDDNCTELVLTKTISIEINDKKEYNQIFKNRDPFSHPIQLDNEQDKSIVTGTYIKEQIQKFCKENEEEQICEELATQGMNSLIDGILNKMGNHTVSEKLILGPNIFNSTNDKTESSVGDKKTNSTVKINGISEMTFEKPLPVLYVPDVNLKDSLIPYAMAQSNDVMTSNSKQNPDNWIPLGKDFRFLNGETYGYGTGKTWSYGYEAWGLEVFFVEAHVEAGLGIGLRIPIDLTVELPQNATSGLTKETQRNATFIVNTANLTEAEYGDLGLDWLKTFEGKEFKIYLGPKASLEGKLFGASLSWEPPIPSIPTPEGSDFIPPLGGEKVRFTELNINLLCEITKFCVPEYIGTIEITVGVDGKLEGKEITMESISINDSLNSPPIIFKKINEARNSTVSSSGNIIENLKYNSTLHFTPQFNVTLGSYLIPYSIDYGLELEGVEIRNVILNSHSNTINYYTIPQDMGSGKCRDGEVNQSNEQCDDGNDTNGDGCSIVCQIESPVCGDLSVTLPEECDDGNKINDDVCSNSCKFTPGGECGDGEVNTVGEECDDGNDVDGDVCSNSCKFTPGGECGDGEVNTVGEECDDGNDVDGDVCSNSC
ncbi:MAG: hypothetical protein OEM79_00005, partial [Nitrosopumilus sp.]|nr:hypothetical protein [Nitrosopumilus sp.]